MTATKLKKIASHRATFWVSLVLVGPFALPLLWRDDRYSKFWKVVITIGTIILTIYLSKTLVDQVKALLQNLEQLRAISESNSQ